MFKFFSNTPGFVLITLLLICSYHISINEKSFIVQPIFLKKNIKNYMQTSICHFLSFEKLKEGMTL